MRRRGLGVLVLGVLGLAVSIAPATASAAFEPVSSFSQAGEGAGQLSEPSNGDYASDGNFYVADFGNNRIDVFSPSGGFLFAFGKEVDPLNGSDLCTAATGCQRGAEDQSARAMERPGDVAFAAGQVYVADEGDNRIDQYTEAGEFVRAFGKAVNVEDGSNICDEMSGCKEGRGTGGAGVMGAPTGITFDNGLLFVADQDNQRIDVFTPEGVFVRAFGKEVSTGAGGGDICSGTECKEGLTGEEAGAMAQPFGITTVPGGNLAITDGEDRRVDVYSFGGGFLEAFGAEVAPGGASVCDTATGCVAGSDGTQSGALPRPTAIAVDGAGSYYVGDGDLQRVSQFSPTGHFIRAFGEGVVNGSPAFQVCTTICGKGIEGTIPGATPNPYGVVFDPQGRLTVVEETTSGSNFARVEKFDDVPVPTVTPPATTPTATPTTPAPVSNKFRIGKLELNRKKGTATLTVSSAAPGKFLLTGKGVRKAKARVATVGGSATLAVHAVGKLKKELAKAGIAKTKVKITFTPNGGKPASKTLKRVLREKLG